MSKTKKKSCNDPIEEYLEKFSKINFKNEEDNNKSSPIFDILLGFLFHFLFVFIFGIFYFQNSSTKNIECKTSSTRYWVKLIITYHSTGAVCCLIIIPFLSFLKTIFSRFSSSLHNLTHLLRVMLIVASFAIFCLIWSEYEWKNECQTLNELLYIYLLLCGTCYSLLIFLGTCLLFASMFGKKENCNKSFINLSNSLVV